MLFNSLQYIYLFLPITAIAYWLLARAVSKTAALWLLLAASLFFYAYYKISYLPLLLASAAANYLLSRLILSCQPKGKRARLLMFLGAAGNIALLGYYKYADFFLSLANRLFETSFAFLHLALPLAISFYTFQQIAYLADCYNGRIIKASLLNYLLFVSFFPQLIAGPIVHYRQMSMQFSSRDNLKITPRTIYICLIFFAFGLAKKIIADHLSLYANDGYASLEALPMVLAWQTTLSYTLQIYLDFSGYCDMAVAAAKLFNFNLPLNFNSPYKAANIKDFWQRWHITLSCWLRDYIYKPLGGNRHGFLHAGLNAFVVFLIGGLWHGAGLTFIIWGALHGSMTLLHRLWNKAGLQMAPLPARFFTFLFIHITWIPFRAKDLTNQSKTMFFSLFNLKSFSAADIKAEVWQLLGLLLLAVWLLPNSYQAIKRIAGWPPKSWRVLVLAIAAGIFFAFYWQYASGAPPADFLYFNF